MICPWPCQLKAISIALFLSFSVNNLMRNTYEASGIIIDVLPIVMFHSGMCVCVFTAKWNWESFKGKDKHVPCFVLYRMMEIRNGGTKWTLYWIWSQMIWINLSLAVTLNKILLILIQYQYHTLNKIHFDLENENITLIPLSWEINEILCENKSALQICKSYISLNNIFVFTLRMI